MPFAIAIKVLLIYILSSFSLLNLFPTAFIYFSPNLDFLTISAMVSKKLS